MRSIRILAIITFALIAAFYGLRALAGACSGPECDAFIPFSLLLPLAALALAAVTGFLAIGAARQRRQGAWLAILATSTLMSIVGPIACAFVFRDNPDVFVPVATALIALAPLSALVYSLTANQRP
jgi:CHASE2 domain-containing sensor protein